MKRSEINRLIGEDRLEACSAVGEVTDAFAERFEALDNPYLAERAIDLMKAEPMEIPFEFGTMSQKVYAMVKKSLDSLVKLDLHEAHEVISLDDEVDALHHKSYGMVIERIRQQPENIEALISYLVVSRYLERIADLSTNICEDVIYIAQARVIKHHAEEKKA